MRSWRRPAAAACTAGVLGLAAVGFSRVSGRSHPRAAVAVAPYVLQVAAGEEPLTVMGRWQCGPERPAVLDARSGSIWVFPAWPSRGSSVSGRFVARVPGAAGVGVAPSGPECDRLVVLRGGQPDLTVPVEADGG
jgi:hypothetical protein